MQGKNQTRGNCAGGCNPQSSGETCRALSRRRKSRGFSLLELLVVLAIMLIVSAIAIPTVTATMDAYRTRGTLTSVAGLFQRSRVQALKHNTTEHLYFTPIAGQVQLYSKDLNDPTQTLTTTDPQLLLPLQFSTPGLAGPSVLTGQIMWGANVTPLVDTDPYFNSRGLPCAAPAAGAACSNISGYLYYFKYTSSHTRWAAISVSPAGRVQTWFWNGTSWGN